MNYENNQPTTKPKKIVLKIYKTVDEAFQTSLLLNKSLQAGDSFETLYNQYEGNNTLYTDSVINTIKSIWAALSSSGKMIKQLKRNSETLEYTYTTPIETADSKFYFSDLKIKFKEYASYQIVFIIDGIESDLSPIIKVVKGLDGKTTSQTDVN